MPVSDTFCTFPRLAMCVRPKRVRPSSSDPGLPNEVLIKGVGVLVDTRLNNSSSVSTLFSLMISLPVLLLLAVNDVWLTADRRAPKPSASQSFGSPVAALTLPLHCPLALSFRARLSAVPPSALLFRSVFFDWKFSTTSTREIISCEMFRVAMLYCPSNKSTPSTRNWSIAFPLYETVPSLLTSMPGSFRRTSPMVRSFCVAKDDTR